MYTLEKHLSNYSEENSDFEILNSIWNLNKKHIPNAQSAISFNFPHYSQHDKSHSDTIIKNIESFLGEERIEQLSPTDTWLILMSTYTHDLGMVVFHKTLEKKWPQKDFQDYLKKVCENSSDDELQQAAELLSKIQESLNTETEKDDPSNKDYNLPLKVRNAVMLVTADFFRKSHHYRSKEMILGEDEEFFNLVDGFSIKGVPSRFAEVLSEIAFAHGIDFYKIFERLEKIAKGYGSDKMHPRFIACLLRLGDLLDVDDKRFNPFTGKVFSDQLPHTSQLHVEKHSAVKHLLISPNSIEVTVDCKSDEVYREAREWFDWLQQEVRYQSTEWANIAPTNMHGMPPTISRGKIKVLYKSSEPKNELMNLRFAISNKKIFEMFEGAAIYRVPGFVFIRELIQNALDASKIQLWKMIKNRNYDYALRRHLKLPSQSEDILSHIKFPHHIPEELWENFKIFLSIQWKDEKKEVVVVEVSDNGTGITEKDLIRMTQKVGESRSEDFEYQEFKESMPYWLKPTGAFGIGLQSLFLVTNKFIVETKASNEEVLQIEFHSAKKGEYSRVTDNKPNMNRGTKVILEIKINNFNDESYRYPIGFNAPRKTTIYRDSFDFFCSEFENNYLHVIAEYIETNFDKVKILNSKILNTFLIEKTHEDFDDLTNGNFPLDCGFFSLERKKEYGALKFNINENIVGSEMEFNFHVSYRHSNSELTYLVRDIPVQAVQVYNGICKYCDVTINFKSENSDKLLNISRDTLIHKAQMSLNEKIVSILPKLLPKMIDDIEGNADVLLIDKEIDPELLVAQYFHLELNAIVNKIKAKHSKIIYGERQMMESIFNFNFSAVTFQDFFNAETILLINVQQTAQYETLVDGKKNFLELLKNWLETEKNNIYNNNKIDILIVNGTENYPYYHEYLQASNYCLKWENYYEIPISKHDVVLTVIEKSENENDFLMPVLSDNKNLSITHFGSQRALLLPFRGYADLLAVKKTTDNRNFKHYTHHYIYSPFKNAQELLLMKRKLQENLQQKTSKLKDAPNSEILSIIDNKFIDKLVPEKMKEWVLNNSSMVDTSNYSDEQREERKKEIRKKYIELTYDILLANE